MWMQPLVLVILREDLKWAKHLGPVPRSDCLGHGTGGSKKKKWALLEYLHSFLAWRGYIMITRYYNSFITFWNWFSERFILCCLTLTFTQMVAWCMGIRYLYSSYKHKYIKNRSFWKKQGYHFAVLLQNWDKISPVFSWPRNKLVENHQIYSFRR